MIVHALFTMCDEVWVSGTFVERLDNGRQRRLYSALRGEWTNACFVQLCSLTFRMLTHATTNNERLQCLHIDISNYIKSNMSQTTNYKRWMTKVTAVATERSEVIPPNPRLQWRERVEPRSQPSSLCCDLLLPLLALVVNQRSPGPCLRCTINSTGAKWNSLRSKRTICWTIFSTSHGSLDQCGFSGPVGVVQSWWHWNNAGAVKCSCLLAEGTTNPRSAISADFRNNS